MTHQAAASGAKRHANGDFLAAYRGAREKQIGHVGTGDEQNKPHDSHQQDASKEQRLPFRTVSGFGQGPQRDRLALICVWVLLFESGCNDVHLGPSLSKRKTRPETADSGKERNRPVAQGVPLLGRQDLLRHHRRDPHIGAKNSVQPFKAFGPDADNSERGVVELDRPPEDVRRSAKAALPCRVAEHDDSSCTRRGVLARKEEPAHERADPEHIKIIGGHDFHENPVRLGCIGHGNRHWIRVSCQAAEGMRPFPEILDIQERQESQFTGLRCHLRLCRVQGDQF